MTIKDIRPPEEVPLLLADISSHGGAGSREAKDWRHLRRDGSEIDVEVTTGRIDFEGHHAVLVVAHDVSERKRLERRLTDAEKMEAIGRLAGGVAHDFNNLLTVISGYTEILLARDGGEELEEIARAARQAAGLTRQLLAFSRRQVLHPKVLDLNEIVAGMETMLHRIIGDDVSVGDAARGGPLGRRGRPRADRARDPQPRRQRPRRDAARRRAHARDAQRRARGRTARTSSPARTCCSPSPTPASAWTRRSARTCSSRSSPPSRAARARAWGSRPCSASSSRAAAASTSTASAAAAPRSRSTCRRRTPAPASAGRAARARAGGGTETMLVVEDDANVRELVRLLLESNGYTVLTVHERRRGRARVHRAARVDLLLTDVVMPDVGGQELAERVAAAVAGHAHPVHVRLFRRGRAPPRRAGRRARPSSRSRSPSGR